MDNSVLRARDKLNRLFTLGTYLCFVAAIASFFMPTSTPVVLAIIGSALIIASVVGAVAVEVSRLRGKDNES